MVSADNQNLRDIGIVAHIDAGKTTLTERILYETGSIRVCGEVHEGTTVSDFLLQERERGISIVSAAVSCRWRDTQINLVDTPGHIDFTAEVERTLRVMDGVVAVFCAVSGVQAQSETVLRSARRCGLPVLAFINKMDREGADAERTISQLSKLGTAVPVPVQYPVFDENGFVALVDAVTGRLIWGKIPEAMAGDVELEADDVRGKLVEVLADADDELLDCFLSGRRAEDGLLKAVLRKATLANQVIPVFYGSALKKAGVDGLLDGVVEYLPAPEDRLSNPVFKRQLTAFGGNLKRDDGTIGLCVQVFKVVHGWQDTAAAARIFSGELARGTVLHNVDRKCDFAVDRLYRLAAGEMEEIEWAAAGDVVGISAKDLNARTGDTLCGPGLKVKLARIRFPEPVISQVIEAIGEEGRTKLSEAVRFFAEEDPTLRVKRGADAGQCVLSGMGELHLDVVRSRLKSEFRIDTRAGNPTVAYKATVLNPVQGEHRFVKQLTPEVFRDATVSIALKPLPRNSGVKTEFPAFEKENCPIPPDCQEAVRTAVKEAVEAGGPNNCPLTDIDITVCDASFVAVEASELAFLTATRNALQELLDKAVLALLEPVMRLEVSSPKDYVGNVLADLTARHAKISDLDTTVPCGTRIIALAPLAELFGYATQLRSLTGGRAEFVAEPAEYQFCGGVGKKKQS